VRLRLLGLAALTAAAACVTAAGPAAAAAPSCAGLPKHTALPVVDTANVVKPEALGYLAADLVRYHVTGHEAIVVTTVPDLGGDDVASYARRLFDCWGVGDADSDNGVLILVSMREHRLRIELGAGLESRVSEEALERALDTMVAPMRKGDVGGALRAAAVSIAKTLGTELPDTQHNPTAGLGLPSGVPTAPGDVSDATDGSDATDVEFPYAPYGPNGPEGFGPYGDGGSDSPGSGFVALVPLLIGVGLVSTIVRAVVRGGSSGGGHSTWRGGFPGSGYRSGMWGSGSVFHGGGWSDSGSSGSSSFGSGSSGSSGSSGGSSGGSFGGGSGGGGGASGSW
jgi:uncharacterized protein